MSPAITKPDFAYPKKVSGESRAQLHKALSAKDGEAIVRALINLEIADGSISSDNVPKVVSLIDSIAGIVSDGSTKALLYLLQADIYNSIYSAERWKYDQRQLPPTQVDNNCFLWSGNQFRQQISSLCKKALGYATELKSTPLDKFGSVMETDRMTNVYYPTLYDFAAWKSISMLQNSENAPGQPLLRLEDRKSFLLSSRKRDEILNIYADLLIFHAKNPAPMILAEISRINYSVNNGVYSQTINEKRRQLLTELYSEWSDNEYSGDVLIAIDELGTDPEQRPWLYNAVRKNIRQHPSYWRINCLKNMQSYMECKEVSLQVPQMCAPGIKAKVNIQSTNANKITLNIYRLQDNLTDNANYNSSTPINLPKTATYEIEVPGTIPFITDTAITITLPKTGIYVLESTIPGVKSDQGKRSFPKIYCSEIALGSLRFDKTTAVVINPMSGSPIEGASLMRLPSRKSETISNVGNSDRNGFVRLTKSRSGSYVAIKGNDRTSRPTFISIYEQNDRFGLNRKSINPFTDLALYKPGDSVKWAAVIYEIGKNTRDVCENAPLTAELRDANGQPIDTIETRSDSFGRCEGSFLLPKGLLNGRFTIRFRSDDARSNCSFTVSDYKLPEYFVEITKVLKNEPDPDGVTLEGIAKTYSGAPLPHTNVTLNLAVAPRYPWISSHEVPFYTDTVTTGDDGVFTFAIPHSILKESGNPGNSYMAEITAVSQAGETQTSSKRFATGPSEVIMAVLPRDLNVENPVKLNLKVVNSENSQIDADVEYKILRQSQTVMSGKLETSSPTVDWEKIPGGVYDIIFTIPGDTAKFTDIAVYKPSDQLPPRDQPVWMPSANENLKATKTGGRASLMFGTTSPKAYILYTLWTPNAILEQRWIEKSAGIHTLEINLPDSVDTATASLSSTYGLKSASGSVTIDRTDSEHNLLLTTESFRDKIVPGMPETWTFRVKNNDGSPVTAAVILDMYNSALDALAPHHQSFNTPYATGYYYSWDGPWFLNKSYFNVSSRYTTLRCPQLREPIFNTYGHTLFTGGMYSRGGSNLRLMSMKSAMTDDVINAAEHSEIVVVKEAKSEDVYMAAAPTENRAVMTDSGSSDMETEEADEEVAVEGMAEEANRSFAYRDGIQTLAFFEPMLTTDANGNLSYSFTAPNANVTWQLNAIAFSKDVRTASLAASIVSNKPIMVQPNLPRFVRTGDIISIKALVINNTDSLQTVCATIELFNPTNGKTMATKSETLEITARMTATCEIKLSTPSDIPFIGYRIKGSTDIFADGEQTLIPVLPSSTPVIETIPFYAVPKSKSVDLTLKPASEGTRTTLQFCENPAWYVVTALPGLRESSPNTSPAAADAIFSAAVAQGLLRTNPAIATALKEWTASQQNDSTLVSMLQRNSDLKTLLLAATPWLTDAMSDTERMERLALLFDKNEVESTYAASISVLEKLQQEDGGWAWISQSHESSEWATTTILQTIGKLIELEFMPNDRRLKNMVDRATDFIDRKAAKQYRKYPDSDFTWYVAMRNSLKTPIPQNCKAIVSSTVQNYVKNWKKAPLSLKPTIAILLYNNNYRSVAREIIESMRQFAVVSPTQGMHWPNMSGGIATVAGALNAFHKIAPESKDIDLIRQWLILNKEANNWGGSMQATEVIASILTTSEKWISDAGDIKLNIDGNYTPIPDIDNRLGYFRTGIPAESQKITISGLNGSPAWGAVYRQSIQIMRNVEAASCEAISIKKELLKQTASGWTEAKDVSVGDKVRVQLTITTTRDMEYVAITDDRAACLEPVEQLPHPIYAEGLYFYLENRDASTELFITHLPKGAYILTYDMWVNNNGVFASGIATAQSQYAPELTAHSSGGEIIVK